MNINVHIERLILDGLPVAGSQTPMLQAAVEAELARLLAADGLGSKLRAGGEMPSVKAGNIQMASDSAPDDLGRQIAQAVYGGINR